MSTQGEAYREYVRHLGEDRPNQCWVLTVWDTWERNPFYNGPDQPHPEDDHMNVELDPETQALFDYADEHYSNE